MLLTAVLALVGVGNALATTYTVTTGSDTFLHSCTFTNGESTAGWNPTAKNANDNILHFVKPATEADDITLQVQYSDFGVGGLTVDADTNIEGIINNGSRTFYIGKDGSTTASSINRDFTFDTNNGFVFNGTQTWTIAEAVTYTFKNSNITNNAALTLNGLGSVDFTGKTVSGSGSITVSSGTLVNAIFASGTTLALTNGNAVDTVTMSSGSILDLTSATLSADTPLISTSDLTINSGAYVSLNGITEGNTVALFDSAVEGVNFIIDGNKIIAARSEISENNGVYTFTSFAGTLTDMVWNGGATGTWNTSATSWKSASVGEGVAFVNGDAVTFDSSAVVDIAEGVSVAGMTVSGADTILKLTRSNSGYIAGTVTVTDGATMIIGTKTDGQGFVRGEINVTDGTLQYDAKDATGYNGGATSTQKITIASGSELLLNHTDNETFAGTLVLNGTMKGIANGAARWDLFGGKATIQVEAGNHATLENVTLQLRQNDSQISIADNASLTIETLNRGSEGNGSLTLNGTGEFIITGNSDITELRSLNGKVSIGNDTDHVQLTVSRLELGDNGSGKSTLNIASGSTVKVTGANNGALNEDGTLNTHYSNYSFLIGEWVASSELNIDGTLLAASAKAVVGDATMIFNINNGGTMAVAGLGIAEVKNDKTQGTTLTLGDGGKLILGEHGIADNLKSASITLKDGTVGLYSDSTTLGTAMTLAGDTGTIFDTAKYSFAQNGNSIAQAENAEGGSMTISGVLSGSGKLVKEGEGTLSLTATNTYSGGTVVNEGKVEAASGAALGTGNITVAHGASVEITEGTGTITVEAYKDNTDAVIEKAVAYNNASSDSILMGNAKVTVDYADDVTITNIIGKDAKSSAIVNKGTGTVTLTNGFNNLTHIHAQNGDINLQWVMYQKDVTSIILEDGRTLGAHHRDDALTSTANEATLTVTEVATFGKGASLYGNLNLKSGVTLSMDGALSMGSELTLATNLTLDGELMSSLNSLELGSTLLLFSGVDKLTLDTTVYTTLTEDDGYDMSDIFSNVTSDKYYLGYNENGDVYAGVIAPATPVDPTVPEPTTATLSLLALAALAARRRRK